MMNRELEVFLEQSKDMNAIDRWEWLKYEIRKSAKKFAKDRVNETELIIGQLTEKLIQLQENFHTLNTKQRDLLENTKFDLDEIMFEKAKSLIFRSGCKWYEMEGKSTSYFYKLEKNRYNTKTSHSMFDKNGNLVRTDPEILAIQEEFYHELYTSNTEVVFKFECGQEGIPKVSEEDKKSQALDFTYQEIAKAVYESKNGKCPGNDGILVDFYKVFWAKLSIPFMEMLYKAKQEKVMPRSCMLGIISIIPKANKDTRYVRNMRPITLLNSDYKIIEKVIANRMLLVLPYIINSDQKGFMKGRRISVNVRKIFDLILLADSENMESVVLSLDFEKCFNKIEFNAIFGAMRFFNFHENLIKWVQLLYHNFCVNVQNNGYFSNRFPVERSVHQGGCCSSFLFLLCAEILAISVRTNTDIKGIHVKEFINVIGQFVDDADMYLMNDKRSFEKVIACLENFQYISGSTVNYDKTQVYRIGSLKNTDYRIITQRAITWTNEDINVLGVWVGHDLSRVVAKNYDPIVEKAAKILDAWTKRNLSLIAKVNVINTLIASLFPYKMYMLPNLPSKFVKKMEKVFSKFLWCNTTPKIALRTLQLSKKSGGLGLINLVRKEMAIKISWINILLFDDKARELCYFLMCPLLKEDIWRCNLSPKDVKYFCEVPFWQDVLTAWCMYNYEETTSPQMQFLWLNSQIRVMGRPILWKGPYEKGLKYVSQIQSTIQLSVAENLCQKFGISQMQTNMLLSALPMSWRKEIMQPNFNDNGVHNYDLIVRNTKLVARVYEDLSIDYSVINEKMYQWQKEFDIEGSFRDCFNDLYKVTNVCKLWSFQYKLLMRVLVTNVHLERWKVLSSNLCTFCQKDKESYIHLFIWCEHVKNLWLKVETFMNEFSTDHIVFGVDMVICNRLVEDPSHVKNFLCLLTKHYIYRQRCLKSKLVFQHYKRYVYQIKSMEKYIAISNQKLDKHSRKWGVLPDHDN